MVPLIINPIYTSYSGYLLCISRWWFQIFFFSPRNLRKWSNLTNTFQMGWFNHQLEYIETGFERWKPKRVVGGEHVDASKGLFFPWICWFFGGAFPFTIETSTRTWYPRPCEFEREYMIYRVQCVVSKILYFHCLLFHGFHLHSILFGMGEIQLTGLYSVSL